MPPQWPASTQRLHRVRAPVQARLATWAHAHEPVQVVTHMRATEWPAWMQSPVHSWRVTYVATHLMRSARQLWRIARAIIRRRALRRRGPHSRRRRRCPLPRRLIAPCLQKLETNIDRCRPRHGHSHRCHRPNSRHLADLSLNYFRSLKTGRCRLTASDRNHDLHHASYKSCFTQPSNLPAVRRTQSAHAHVPRDGPSELTA